MGAAPWSLASFAAGSRRFAEPLSPQYQGSDWTSITSRVNFKGLYEQLSRLALARDQVDKGVPIVVKYV